MRVPLTCALAVIGAGLAIRAEQAAAPGTGVQQLRDHDGVANVDVSADGRFVAFESMAQLAAEDTNGLSDLYVLDRRTHRLTLESAAHGGSASNGSSHHARLNGDGRYVTFQTSATNLLPGPGAAMAPQVVRRDRLQGSIELVSRGSDGSPGDRTSHPSAISDDGRIVVFESFATNLTARGDASQPGPDIYVFDAERRSVDRISLENIGGSRPNAAITPQVSGDGQYVAFVAAWLDPPVHPRRMATARRCHVYLHHLPSGTTRLVSRTLRQHAADGCSARPDLSTDGQTVVFTSTADNLSPCDRNGGDDVFLFDAVTQLVTLVSRTARRCSGNGRSSHPAVSGDGRYVVFASEASDLVCAGRCSPGEEDLNLVSDVYLFDRVDDRVSRVSGDRAGAEAWWEPSIGPAIDRGGKVVVFSTRHPIAVADEAGDYDLFIRLFQRPPA